MTKRKRTVTIEQISKFLIPLFLAVYLLCGLRICSDYGATSDERNQIKAGHITWDAIAGLFGAEPVFKDLPKLKEYNNRFYGQAATFPTVLIEAASGFSIDEADIIRMRHVWNFLMFFAGTTALAILMNKRVKRKETVLCVLILYVLTPRLFGDAFYNDRDVMEISLYWISLALFIHFQQKPLTITALLSGFFFALTINTRYYGIFLIFLPILSWFFEKREKKLFLIIIFTLIFWFLFTPAFWTNLTEEFRTAFQMFVLAKQRTKETDGNALMLFFGNLYKEKELPFWYLPVWMFISTPLVPQLFALTGIAEGVRNFKRHCIMDKFLLVFLLAGVTVVMIIRPILYNGWRHLFVLYVPFFYFAAIGLDRLLSSPRIMVRAAVLMLAAVSAIYTGYRIKSLHPYEYIYLNPLFQNREDDFDKDYWLLSTTECMNYMAEHTAEHDINVVDIYAFIFNVKIGMPKAERERFHSYDFTQQHSPYEYLIMNYAGLPRKYREFDFYESVYTIERDGAKLAEIFQRTHEGELKSTDVVKNVMIPDEDPTRQLAADNDFSTVWHFDDGAELVLELDNTILLQGFEFFPSENGVDFPDLELFTSEDGIEWEGLPYDHKGMNGIFIEPSRLSWLKLKTGVKNAGISDILFYSE